MQLLRSSLSIVSIAESDSIAIAEPIVPITKSYSIVPIPEPIVAISECKPVIAVARCELVIEGSVRRHWAARKAAAHPAGTPSHLS